ncbi:MAG: NAD(+)/NADH kinase [Deltaproteobacteria bacterium]|nr:NAD(+)/NADH kinase [Deltaproteobacteria bacterium]MBW2053640.1 NAD(+)/NADH kinase [Deltaproteobacteria bacterium]MBW2142614.1 NAD(+)/NADH kinase [Deltaproteobacteria bacterium]
MEKIGLVVKKAAQKARLAAADLETWLRERGLEVIVDEVEVTINSGSCPTAPPSPIPSDVDLVVVLGGDGTLLYAARAVRKIGAPLLGVNLGGLGFLTEIGLKDLYPTMEKVLAGDFRAEARMLLEASVQRSGQTVAQYTVLNDAVINKSALARILDLKVKIDGKDLTAYRADGLIISTPTGSTAYNLSAGGPIVYPAHESILLTPICPFTLSNRPLILPETAKIEIEVDPKASDLLLTADGQAFCNLEPGDTITAQRSSARISLIKNPYKDYFEILKTKLGWG